MSAVLVFAVILVVALLISELADRSVISTAVLFLVAGAVAGSGGLGLLAFSPRDPVVSTIATLALFSILFTDGMRVGARELGSAWHLPGRALILGMPLTMLLIALFGKWLLDVSWLEALLVGAVLSPTDPVFAAAIVGREEIPARLRQLLNVESGLNDGLALPVVLALLALLAHRSGGYGQLAIELALGAGTGIVVPWLSIRLERKRFLGVASSMEPLFVFAIGLLVLAITSATDCNPYLGAFAAGITIATIAPERRDEFHRFGELIAELLKLAALLLFGSLLSPQLVASIGLGGIVFALLMIVVARPLVIELVLLRSPLDWRERATAAWFGPKGFASVIYGILILEAGVPHGEKLFQIVAFAIALSIVAHSSSDVPISRWFRRTTPAA